MPSYGVRDYAADVNSGPDETTGEVNAELLIGQLRDGLVSASGVDPNAAISGSTQTVDGDSIDDERFFTTSTPEGDSPSTPAGSTSPSVTPEQLRATLSQLQGGSSGGLSTGTVIALVVGAIAFVGGSVALSDGDN